MSALANPHAQAVPGDEQTLARVFRRGFGTVLGFDLVARIPAELKPRGLKRKYVLKRATGGVLPRDVVWHRKAGFGAPIRSWLVNELRLLVDDALVPERIAERGLLDPAALRRSVEDERGGREDNALRIWALIILELWQQVLLVGTPPDGRRSKLEAAIGGLEKAYG